MDNYLEKYLKYKQKYFNLQFQNGGNGGNGEEKEESVLSPEALDEHINNINYQINILDEEIKQCKELVVINQNLADKKNNKINQLKNELLKLLNYQIKKLFEQQR